MTALPVNEYAASLGLPGVPKIKFLNREKTKEKKNASRQLAATQDSDSDAGSDEESNDSDDAPDRESDHEDTAIPEQSSSSKPGKEKKVCGIPLAT